MIQFIASDLDGTLLQNDAQELNPEIFDLILKLKEKGIHFIAASGRQYANMRRLFAPIQNEISYVAENGSLCVHNGKVVSRGLIDRELGLRIFETAKGYPGIYHNTLSTENYCYTDSTDPAFIHHISKVIGYDTKVVKDFHEVEEPFLKIALCDFTGNEALTKYLAERFASEIKVVTSGNLWTDFIAPNANKGSALLNVLDHLGLKPENGIAFGDQYNDVEMLKLVGTSYAMANAAPGIENYADYVTDSVEKVLRKLVSDFDSE